MLHLEVKGLADELDMTPKVAPLFLSRRLKSIAGKTPKSALSKGVWDLAGKIEKLHGVSPMQVSTILRALLEANPPVSL